MCDELLSDEELYGDYEPPFSDEPLDFLEAAAFIEEQTQFGESADSFMRESAEEIPNAETGEDHTP